MRWEKLKLIYKFSPICEKLISHASNPLPVHKEGSIFRVFFSGRDSGNKSSIGFVDLDMESLEVVNVNNDSLINFGAEASFYSHGISIGNFYKGLDGENYIPFMGWQIPEGKHWRGDIGRLKLSKDLSSISVSPDEVFIGVDEEDLVSLSYPFVMYHEELFKMWYGSTISWESENGEMIHVIKYATSKDGVNWDKHGVAIPFKLGEAQAFSRPWVKIDKKGMFHMWYSYRSGSGELYRIGYAKSKDGLNWVREHQNVGISVSKTGWDSEMICYAAIFDYKDKTYMFYNGNSFGRDGFGVAVLDS